jgi:hypothetical protein
MPTAVHDDERQPLLKKEVKAVTPLPKVQMAIVCFVRMTEPIAFAVCFPFINQMLLDVGAVDNPKDVGWPAGIVSTIVTVKATRLYRGTAQEAC